MMIIFATLTVDPAQRDEIATEISRRLEQVAPANNGALEFEFMSSAADPSRLHVFQVWESEATFAAWGAVAEHRALQEEFRRFTSEVTAKMYGGCTELEH